MSVNRRKLPDPGIEKKMLTGLIVSDKVAGHICPILTPRILDADSSKIVAQWIVEFYTTYRKAPGKMIQDIYEIRKDELNIDDKEIISEFLNDLSEDYLNNGSSLNEDYILDESMKHLKRLHLTKVGQEVMHLASSGRVDDAEKRLEKFREMMGWSRLSKWVKPFDDMEFINEVFDSNETDELFQFAGELGRLVGPAKRGWLVGLMGPMKRGKTWGFQNIALEAVTNKLRTAFISLEMTAEQMALRQYMSLGSFTESDNDLIFPCFDCIKNASNSCSNPHRTNAEDRPPFFDPAHPYQPCTWCRTNSPRNYRVTTWFEEISRPKLGLKDVRKLIKQFNEVHGDKLFRLISYPAYSASLTDIMSDLDTLEFSENWVPDVIIIDYADILAPEDPGMKKLRDQIDVTWKTLKRLSTERRVCVFTGTQGSRATFEIDTIQEKHTPEDIRKLAHVDAMLTLNQTEQEKNACITRVGLLTHRWKKFDKKLQAIVLQQFEAGQFHLDSEILYYNDKRAKDNDDASYANLIPRRRLKLD
jgi:replicative DNA helicase